MNSVWTRRTAATIAALVLVATASFAATQRKVSGIITQVDPATMSIQPIHGKSAVSGKIGARTKVTIDGRAANATTLRVTYDAKAELGLDDVWISVRAESQ